MKYINYNGTALTVGKPEHGVMDFAGLVQCVIECRPGSTPLGHAAMQAGVNEVWADLRKHHSSHDVFNAYASITDLLETVQA